MWVQLPPYPLVLIPRKSYAVGEAIPGWARLARGQKLELTRLPILQRSDPPSRVTPGPHHDGVSNHGAVKTVPKPNRGPASAHTEVWVATQGLYSLP